MEEKDRIVVGENAKSKEIKAGDVLIIENPRDPIVGHGSKAVIQGKERRYNKDDRKLSVVVRHTTPHLSDRGTVTASGGPVKLINKEELVHTGKTTKKVFWDFKNGIPAGNNSKRFKKEVNIWKINQQNGDNDE